MSCERHTGTFVRSWDVHDDVEDVVSWDGEVIDAVAEFTGKVQE